MTDIDKAIEIVKASQTTHKEWWGWIDEVEHFGLADKPDVQKIIETAGDKRHQEECVERYQFVIDTLESLR